MNATELYVNRFYWFKKILEVIILKIEDNDTGIEDNITILLEEMTNDLPRVL